MDNSLEDISPSFDIPDTLSYDDTVSYEEQLPPQPSNDAGKALANRIGSTKVYLLAESATGKRKHDLREWDEGKDVLDAEVEEEEEAQMEEDLEYRPNALLFQGPPISHLPTARLFAYATHFDTHPMGLEWVDDTTCVFVFTSKATARTAYRHLQKSATEDADVDGFVTAKPIPVALWPPEERINKSLGLGKTEGLKAPVRMRWARGDDVKKRGAKKDSEFYRKHGVQAGKELYGTRPERAEREVKRRRMDEGDVALEKARLDDDLDQFLAADPEEEVLAEEEEEELEMEEPPSKMRSDYIANDGRTLLERTSLIRAHPDTLATRLVAPLPKRARERDGSDRKWGNDRSNVEWSRERGDRRSRRDRNEQVGRRREEGREGRSSRGERRPRKSQQELDDELEAFLNEKE